MGNYGQLTVFKFSFLNLAINSQNIFMGFLVCQIFIRLFEADIGFTDVGD